MLSSPALWARAFPTTWVKSADIVSNFECKESIAMAFSATVRFLVGLRAWAGDTGVASGEAGVSCGAGDRCTDRRMRAPLGMVCNVLRNSRVVENYAFSIYSPQLKLNVPTIQLGHVVSGV